MVAKKTLLIANENVILIKNLFHLLMIANEPLMIANEPLMIANGKIKTWKLLICLLMIAKLSTVGRKTL